MKKIILLVLILTLGTVIIGAETPAVDINSKLAFGLMNFEPVADIYYLKATDKNTPELAGELHNDPNATVLFFVIDAKNEEQILNYGYVYIYIFPDGKGSDIRFRSGRHLNQENIFAPYVNEMVKINDADIIHLSSGMDILDTETFITALNVRVAELENALETNTTEVTEESNTDKSGERIAELEGLLAKSKELEDPYLVRQLNLNRKLATPYFILEGMLDGSDELDDNIIGTGRGALGVKFTFEKTGSAYILLEGYGGGNTDEEWNAGGRMIISFPNQIFEFESGHQVGTNGDGTYLYEGMDGFFYGLINMSAKVNLLYEDSIRIGAKAGLELSTENIDEAKYVNFDFEITPPHFPYLTFAIDQFSFANIKAGNGDTLYRYKAGAGFDINWTAGHDKDPQWIGNTFSTYIKADYQILDNKTNPSVTDYITTEVGARLLFQ